MGGVFYSRRNMCKLRRIREAAPQRGRPRKDTELSRAQKRNFCAPQGDQSFVFSWASFAAMNARISGARSSSLSHCSLYKVTGKRPMP